MAIELSWLEVKPILDEAALVCVYDVAAGRHHRHGMASTELATDMPRRVQGMLGERAVAKATGTYYDGISRGMHAGDLPNGWEVRATEYSNGRLIVHPDDPDDRIFWLVTNVPKAITVTVAGYIRGGDAKNQAWWSDPTGLDRWAYFVPRDAMVIP